MPRLTKDEWSTLIGRYQSGELAGTLAKEFGCSGAAISAMLQRKGIVRHDASFVYRTAAGCILNDGAFSIITPEAVYWVGFLMADGSVTNGNTVGVVLSERDVDHVEKFRQFMGSRNKIIREIPSRYSDSHKMTLACRFAFRSARVCADLAAHGVVRQKTHTAKASNQLAMNRDFWRGVVDGDGHVALHHMPSYFNRHPKINAWSKPRDVARLELVGSKVLLTQFLEFVISVVPDTKASVRPHKSIFRVSIGGLTAARVVDNLYTGATVALERKANAAINIRQAGVAEIAGIPWDTRESTAVRHEHAQ